jgi:hypothetical protein
MPTTLLHGVDGLGMPWAEVYGVVDTYPSTVWMFFDFGHPSWCVLVPPIEILSDLGLR